MLSLTPHRTPLRALTPASVSPAFDGETAKTPMLSTVARAIRHLRIADFWLNCCNVAHQLAITDTAKKNKNTIFI